MVLGPNAREAIAYLVSATMILGTFGVWLLKTYHGQPTNALVAAVALILVLAGARKMFGPGAIGKSIEALANVKDAASGEYDRPRNDDE